ncbi:hypothetical protein [Streptomyces sp. NPDC020681]|uniref:hypothetical protein n=1 Tax=Streptomyces sp. NPDC020681 TaxID=3365083 RepID=UPI00378C0F6B
MGGVVRVGQMFTCERPSPSTAADVRLSLDRIERYGRDVDFVDPPHSARVHLSGDWLPTLVRGDILSSLPAGAPIDDLET